LFDIGGHIREAIDDWFRGLVTSALDPVLSLLGQTVLATPDVTGPGRVRDLWAVAAGIANAAFVLVVLVGGVIVMTHETLQTRYSAKEIVPRLVVGMIAANASLAVVGMGIHIANALSQALLGEGVAPVNATAAMRDLLLAPLATGGIFLILLGLVAAVLAVVVLAIYILRIALLVLLTAAAPLALATHGLPQTEGTARLWWRALVAILAVQVGQSFVLVAALRVFFDSGQRSAIGLGFGGSVVDMLVAICLLWVLLRIPSWALRAAFAGTGHRPSAVLQVVKYGVIAKAAKAGLAAL
jgi:hypothetical protein